MRVSESVDLNKIMPVISAGHLHRHQADDAVARPQDNLLLARHGFTGSRVHGQMRMTRLDNIDYWRLADELTVVQAALLVVGEDPGSSAFYVEQLDHDKRPIGYEDVKHSIIFAIISDTIEGYIEPEYVNNEFDGTPVAISKSIDVGKSMIKVASLQKWLASRGVRTGFFFPDDFDKPSYLDTHHERYSAKLAAAVAAWEAMSDETLLQRKSPKQALIKWLREHAVQFDLTSDEGKPNETGIEEVAKVANWQLSGGAPKTLSDKPTHLLYHCFY